MMYFVYIILALWIGYSVHAAVNRHRLIKLKDRLDLIVARYYYQENANIRSHLDFSDWTVCYVISNPTGAFTNSQFQYIMSFKIDKTLNGRLDIASSFSQNDVQRIFLDLERFIKSEVYIDDVMSPFYQ